MAQCRVEVDVVKSALELTSRFKTNKVYNYRLHFSRSLPWVPEVFSRARRTEMLRFGFFGVLPFAAIEQTSHPIVLFW